MRRVGRLAAFWAPAAFCLAAWAAGVAGGARAEQGSGALMRTERFDRDPGWDGHNNRSQVPPPRAVRPDFGYSRTAHAGRGLGGIGGFVTPASEPAYYARVIPACGLRDALSASG